MIADIDFGSLSGYKENAVQLTDRGNQMRVRLTTSFVLLPILVFVLSSRLYAESQLNDGSGKTDVSFDLAEIPPGSTTEKTLSDGKIDTISFLNTFWPRLRDYEIDKLVEIEEIEPFPITTFEWKVSRGLKCTGLGEALENFMKLKDSDDEWIEKQVPEKIKELRDSVRICERKYENPIGGDKDNIELAKKILANTRITFNLDQKLKMGERLVIKLRRDDNVWNFIFRYPRGKWLTYYGLCFVSKYTRKHDHYFLRESNDSQEGYVLVAEEKPDLLDFEYVPCVFFTWMPFKRMSKSHSFGFSGGIGIDLQSPVVFAGCSLVIQYNICLNFGIAFHKQYQLKPQYYSDTGTMTVDSLLSFEDLHRSVYRPSVSIGIAFRFDSNPFAESIK